MQEDYKLKDSMSNIARPSQKQQNTKSKVPVVNKHLVVLLFISTGKFLERTSPSPARLIN